jgi:hypothetical protein
MKKTILFIAVLSAFSFASCKKDRVCTCTSTVNGVSSGSPEIITYTKAKKADARAACSSVTVTETMGGSAFVIVKTCTLK